MTASRPKLASRDFVVLVSKATAGGGIRRIVFSRYAARREAELVAARLKTFGCAATVEPARPTDVAGCSRSRP